MSDTNTNQFAPISLGKINHTLPLPADIYVKINDKYIKFKERGDVISEEKYNLFLSKNIGLVYVTLDGVKQFIEWLKVEKEKTVKQIVKEAGEEFTAVVEKKVEITEKIYDVFASSQLDHDKVNLLQGMAANFVEEFAKKKVPAEVLAKLENMNRSVAGHSANVADLAVLFAMATGHAHQFVLENVYIGALFHDYGKAKIPPHILEKPKSVQYSQAIQDHPVKGAELLKKQEGILEEQVITIVLQHHELFSGGGFPKGLKGDAIYGLAQIVSMANVVDNLLADNKQDANRYKKVMKAIEYDKGRQFNPELSKRIGETLSQAWKTKIKG